MGLIWFGSGGATSQTVVQRPSQSEIHKLPRDDNIRGQRVEHA